MAYHRGQNSTFEFDVLVYNFYLDLQLNIQVSYFSTLLVDLTLFVSRLNFVVRSIQHSSLRNSTFNFRKYPTASQSMTVSVGSANYFSATKSSGALGTSMAALGLAIVWVDRRMYSGIYSYSERSQTTTFIYIYYGGVTCLC